jgi:hypothetical protein
MSGRGLVERRPFDIAGGAAPPVLTATSEEHES